MTDIKRFVIETLRALQLSPGDYELVMLPDGDMKLDGGWGIAFDDPKDRKVYISDRFKDKKHMKEALFIHEWCHKVTGLDEHPITDELCANFVSLVKEPEGFFKLVWRTLTSWERIKMYWDTYAMKI